MKSKQILLCVFTLLLFTLSSCKEEKIKCKITSPENEAEFWRSQSIPVTVEASTNKGSLIQVQILLDDQVIGSCVDTPYHFTIPAKTASTGMHYLTAAAYSSDNLEVNNIFIIINGVTCNITSPKEMAEFRESESIPVTVETSSHQDSVSMVKILVDDRVIVSCTEPPYHFTIPANTILPGMHYLTATAYGSQNQETDKIFIVIK